MKMYNLTEGIVDSAKGDIIQAKNSMATEIVQIATEVLDYPEPDLELADTSDDVVNIYFELGKNKTIPISQVIMIELVADDDITIRMPVTLAKRLHEPHDYYKLGSIADVRKVLENIQRKIRSNLLGHR